MPAYSFDSRAYDPQYGASLQQFPPAKKIKVMIVGSEQKPTAAGTGGYLQFILRCVEGPMQGKEGFDNLNLLNPNAKTVEIANKQLAAYCRVTGVLSFNATEELHNKPFLIDVDWQKGNEPSEAKPEGGYTQVTALYDVAGNPPAKAGQGATQTAPVVVPPVAAPAAVQATQPVSAWGQAPANTQGWGKS
jgi:hypothetical protein